MAIRGSFLDPDNEAVHAVRECLALAQMAHTRLNLATPLALVTLLLELLNHPWADLLTFHNLAFTLAGSASCHIVGIVGTTAATVGADDFTVVLQFKVSP